MQNIEKIFSESRVITNIDTEHIVSYTIEKLEEILPDEDFAMATLFDNEFAIILSNNNIEMNKISAEKMTNIITLLHKYRIIKYYNRVLDCVVQKIMRYQFWPDNLHANIITDIINHDPEYKTFLDDLLTESENECQLQKYLLNGKIDPELHIKYDHIDYIEEFIKENICHTENICKYAARHNKLSILRWARDMGLYWNEETIEEAIKNGNFNILKWAHQKGCPWDSRTCSAALSHRYFHIFKWAIKNGCDYDDVSYIYLKDFSRTKYNLHHLKAMEWMHDRYKCFCKPDLKEFVKEMDLILLNVIHIPDIVDLIKDYL